MTYNDCINYLFQLAPSFQQVGKVAYKEGLSNTYLLDEHFEHPSKNYKIIHVAGTNGKGSTAHTIAAVLQSEGYKVGLYTSPHLADFRERIKINGKSISEERVIRFVEEEKNFFEPLCPSFFELTTALAFLVFKEEKVDYAVVEVGLGGRLDCTNIVDPILSVITNISKDHTQFLGDTLEKIAEEKAGIIKSGVPVVVGETLPDTRSVFLKVAKEKNAPIIFAEDSQYVQDAEMMINGGWEYDTIPYKKLAGELAGTYQLKNTNTILHAIEELQKLGVVISKKSVRNAFTNVVELTGILGRWQCINNAPKIICDTGHNVGAFEYLSKQIEREQATNKRIVIGMVKDKDISSVIQLLPKKAVYYFTQADSPRAMPAEEFAEIAYHYGLCGKIFASVKDAYETALNDSVSTDFIYVGGSTYVVSEFLDDVKTNRKY